MSFYLGKAAFLVVIACGLAIPVNAEPVRARGDTAKFIDPVDDPMGLLPPKLSGPLIVSEDDIIGREPASKTVRLENVANTVVDGSMFIPDSIELFADSVKARDLISFCGHQHSTRFQDRHQFFVNLLLNFVDPFLKGR
jgi:hypothetical protein